MVRRLLLLLAAGMLWAPAAHAFEVCAAAKDPSAYVATDRWALIAEQGKDGWIFAQGELMQPGNLGRELDPLTRMAVALRTVGTLPVMLPIPSRLTLAEDKLDPSKKEFASYKLGTMGSMYGKHVAALRKTGWEIVDLMALGKSSGLGADFFNDKDHHWSTQGARITAGRVAELLGKAPLAAGLATKAFSLEEREVRNPGSYRWVVLDRCGIEIPAEVTTSYKSVADEEVSADSLLGDAPPADIVLLGTSQSRRQEYDVMSNRQYFEDSFAALLRHALQADVLNLAAAGGGTFTSIDGWITSREFQSQKPKVVIWELNDTEGFDPPELLRTLVPAVYGRCSKGDAVVAGSGKAGTPVQLSVPAGTKAIGTDYYLALRLSDATVVDFDVSFDHGGAKDTVHIKRSPLLPNSGLFFAELSSGMKKPLSTVTVDLPAANSGRWDARLCKVP